MLHLLEIARSVLHSATYLAQPDGHVEVADLEAGPVRLVGLGAHDHKVVHHHGLRVDGEALGADAGGLVTGSQPVQTKRIVDVRLVVILIVRLL